MARTCHTALYLLRRILLAHQARRILPKSHKAASIHLSGDAISSHGLFRRVGVRTALVLAYSGLVHHRGVKVSLGRILGRWVLTMCHYTREQTGLIIILHLNSIHLGIHRLEFSEQVVSLNGQFLTSYRSLTHLFLLLDQFLTCSVQLSLSFIDFTHVV